MGKKDWAQFAPTFTRLLNKGPGIHTAIDAVWPLSEATNFVDVGCGPGQVTGVLAQEYGLQLP